MTMLQLNQIEMFHIFDYNGKQTNLYLRLLSNHDTGYSSYLNASFKEDTVNKAFS